MNRNHFKYPVLLVSAMLLAACSRGEQAANESVSALDGLADTVTSEIRKELATENMSLSRGVAGLPNAEISPTGDLIIDGKTITLDAAQQALAIEYRSRLADIAEAGAKVGLQGAELATKAMKEAVKAAVDGNTASIEQRIKADAEAVRVSAAALCDQLPALYAAQNSLAAAVPEFAPYATMDEGDIKDCHAEATKS